MKITRLEVKGFRSLRDAVWTPGDLNVVIGPNGSGKSNLLKLLDLMATSARGRLDQHILRAGGMAPLLWDGQVDRLSFRLGAAHSAGGKRDLYSTYALELQRVGKNSVGRVEAETMDLHRAATFKASQAHPDTTILSRTRPESFVATSGRNPANVATNKLDEAETFLSTLHGPFFSNVSKRVTAWRSFLDGWRIYQDFATPPESPVRTECVARHEAILGQDGSDLVPALHTLYMNDRDFKEDLDAGMAAAFGQDYEALLFPPGADNRIHLKVRWKSLKTAQSAANLSDGTLRYLYLIAILANPNPPPLIAIDEPETGLHPSMLPIVAEYAVEAARRSQVVLTTHSADLLDAFGDTLPTVTVARCEAGCTSLTVPAEADLRRWLKNYSLGKMYRTGELEARP